MTASIRFAGADDGGAIASIYAPAIVERATSFEYEPPDAAEMGRRIVGVQQRTPWLVYEEAGGVRGYAYASAHRDRAAYQWSVDVSAYVAETAHRRGVARRLYTTLFDLLVLQGFVNAYAGITLPNPASEGLHAAMGFRPVGVYRGVGWKFGRWHDVVWLERELAPRTADPKPPTPLPLLRDTATAAALLRAARPVR